MSSGQPPQKKWPNSADIEDLWKNPTLLVLRYQRTIEIIVEKYVVSNLIPRGEARDLAQHLNTFFWEQIPKLRSQYNGSSLFRTYISNVLRHECLRLTEVERRRPSLLYLTGNERALETDPPGEVLIREYIRLLRVILTLFGERRPKLIICLKAFFKIPIEKPDLVAYWPDCPEPLLAQMIDKFGGNYEGRREPEIFQDLHPLVAGREGLTSTPDSLRRWTSERIGQITRLLDGNPPTANFDRNSLKKLFEFFLAPNFPETL
jgi:hypothetical protein